MLWRRSEVPQCVVNRRCQKKNQIVSHNPVFTPVISGNPSSISPSSLLSSVPPSIPALCWICEIQATLMSRSRIPSKICTSYLLLWVPPTLPFSPFPPSLSLCLMEHRDLLPVTCCLRSASLWYFLSLQHVLWHCVWSRALKDSLHFAPCCCHLTLPFERTIVASAAKKTELLRKRIVSAVELNEFQPACHNWSERMCEAEDESVTSIDSCMSLVDVQEVWSLLMSALDPDL